MAAGLTYHAAYTWSKLINFGCDEYASSCDVQNPYHWQLDKGVAGSNLTNILELGTVFDVPLGRESSSAPATIRWTMSWEAGNSIRWRA